MSTLVLSGSGNFIRTSEIRNPNGTLAIGIESNGVVTYPQRPYFYGWRNVTEGWENFGTTAVNYVYNIVSLNIGNSYNSSTGIFTCPVAGVYMVHPGGIGGQGGGYGYFYVFKNGVNVSARGIHFNANGYNLWPYTSQVFAVNCAANDQLNVRVLTGSASVYGAEHSHCSIWFHG